ncbi:hypothetical protein GCM10022232_58870 [Streptomyces plumbiresistens]|uniref:Uncharacterized protein n=1 Tax=Streptomyces plumbiresistens TaxID=511811 RepID=A0ABP7SD87_9ACTN
MVLNRSITIPLLRSSVTPKGERHQQSGPGFEPTLRYCDPRVAPPEGDLRWAFTTPLTERGSVL